MDIDILKNYLKRITDYNADKILDRIYIVYDKPWNIRTKILKIAKIIEGIPKKYQPKKMKNEKVQQMSLFDN